MQRLSQLIICSFLVLSQFGQDDSSGVSSCCAGLEQSNPTHRVHSSFIPRHNDEIILEVGDAVHVERECEDHWCYGETLLVQLKFSYFKKQ